jgi:rhamnogalacturonyl hydrolase YesR
MAPDLVVEVRQGSEAGWESTDASSGLGRSLGATVLGPSDSMLAALATGRPSGLAPVPGLRLTVPNDALEGELAKLVNLLQGLGKPVPSPARGELDARRARGPLEVAQLLAAEYGHTLDPVVYTLGVAISGRLRLARLVDTLEETSADITRMIEPLVSARSGIVADGAGGATQAGLVWCDELSEATGDTRYANALIGAADKYRGDGGEPPAPCDPDYRTEDMFFASALLGRAYGLTGDRTYLDIMTKFLLDSEVQQPNGLFWHARSVPYLWGRGNGFAAMGYAEALSYLPEDHPDREAVLGVHIRHLEALSACQRASGMLTEVLDFQGSYQEHTVTCMVGYAVARGLRRGWLPDSHRPLADLAWRGAVERISLDGGLVDGCTGTGPQADLRAYLDRPAEFGRDDRTGNLALWFAVEMELLLRQ